MKNDELFDLAEQVGLGFIRHASTRERDKFELFTKLVAEHEREKVKGQIETLHAMFVLASKQRDELMDEQRAHVEAIRGKMQ